MKFMRNKINLLVIIVSLVCFSSCKKTYLTRDPYTAVPLGSAIKSEADLSVALGGVYAGLRNIDLFGRSLPVKGDLQADNSYITTSNSNRYITMNNFTMTSVDGVAAGAWAGSYIVIKNANNLIKASAGVANTANVNQYVGEAYAARALAYFELVRNFAQPFSVSPNGDGVPIVSDSLTFDQTITNYKPARNTVAQVYSKVINDLEKAYGLMTLYRGTAFMSKYAARALEARVYQNMGDWVNAKATSLDVINNSGWVLLAPTAYVSPTGTLGGSSAASSLNTYSPGGYWASPAVQTASKNETLFEISSDLLSNNGFDQLGYIYLQVGGGYGDVLGTQQLYDLYSASDVRRGLMPLAPAGYRGGQAGNVFLNYKYSNPANGTDKDDTKLLRLSDIMLIAAESYYNTGDIVNANLYLNKVAKQRDPLFAGYANVGAQVLEDILTERRKELAFEGQRLFDLLRLQRSWTKVRNQNPLLTIAVSPNNPQLIFPIPQGERDANPNMSQNAGY